MGWYWDNGKENGSYRDYREYIGIIGLHFGLYKDNGKENGSYYLSYKPAAHRMVPAPG